MHNKMAVTCKFATLQIQEKLARKLAVSNYPNWEELMGYKAIHDSNALKRIFHKWQQHSRFQEIVVLMHINNKLKLILDTISQFIVRRMVVQL